MIPGGTRKKDSSAKSLNDIKKSKRKSAKSYPWRNEKKESSSKSLNDVKKSISCFPMMRLINSSYKSHEFGSFRMWQKHYQNKAIYWRETLKKSILEQNAEIVPGALWFRSEHVFLMQIGTFLGFAAIFLTANALYSPVRKENPASRACGKKNLRK